MALPLQKRPFHSFLSYSHCDKSIVDQIATWLEDVAGLRIWYDARQLAPGASITKTLPKAIVNSRSMIICLSRESINSGWVEREFDVAIRQQNVSKRFRIVPLIIDDTLSDDEIPEFLGGMRWVVLRKGQLGVQEASDLVAATEHSDIEVSPRDVRDIYTTCTWQSDETPIEDAICRHYINAGYRLIGDSEDQDLFEGDRIENIIASCGGLLAILPHRGNGSTSSFMLDEIAKAKRLGCPYVIMKEDGVDLPLELAESALGNRAYSSEEVAENRERAPVTLMDAAWSKPSRPHYVFYATDFNEQLQARNSAIRKMIEQITGLPCVMGDDIRGASVQQTIVQRIQDAFVMCADITDGNQNTCIEAGIGLRARRRLYLLAKGPRSTPPFMFRGMQVWHYEDDLQLLGRVHSIMHPHRRRIFNRELAN